MSKYKPKWLVVDVSNWAYKDLFAAGPGAASFRNFTRRIALCRETLSPERIVLAFDSETSFRREIDPGYKANRREAPIGLNELIEQIRQYAIEDEIDCVKADGYEADDCMATITAIALDRGIRVILASSDKDLRQLLVDGGVTQLLKAEHGKTAAEFDYFTTTRLMEEYGLRPDQWLEYQMLVGDSVDNVRGCIGVGPKAAMPLLQSAGTLDAFWKSPLSYKATPSTCRKLSAFRTEANKMRRLVTLRHDVPLPAIWFEEASL